MFKWNSILGCKDGSIHPNKYMRYITFTEWGIKIIWLGFPGGLVVKNLPTNAEDIGSIPGLGRSHMPAEQLSPGATVIAPVLQSLGTATTEPTSHNYRTHVPQLPNPRPQLPNRRATTAEPACPGACAVQQEQPLLRNLWLQLQSGPCSSQLVKSPHSNENPAQSINR